LVARKSKNSSTKLATLPIDSIIICSKNNNNNKKKKKKSEIMYEEMKRRTLFDKYCYHFKSNN